MLGSSLGCFPCKRCPTSPDDTGSKRLEEPCPLLFFSLSDSALQQLAKCCGSREEKSKLHMEKLRGGDKVVTGRGAYTHSILAAICQTRLRSDCGTVCVCLHCCCSMMEDTARNNAPSCRWYIPCCPACALAN